MRMAVVNLQRARDDPFLPQGDHQHGMYFGRPVGFIIIFNDDFTVVDRLSGGWADGVVVVTIVVLPDAHVGQHVVDIGDGDGIGVNITTDDIADLA